MHHLVTALQSGPFVNSLCKKPAKVLDELRQRAAKFMQLEELHDYHNNVQVDIGGDKGKEKDRDGKHAPE